MTSRSIALMLKTGVVLMLAAALDPMEGSIVIVMAMAVTACAAGQGRSPYRGLIYTGLALGALGVSALWGLSALGGFGGDSGRSIWWGLTLIPYPVGWVLALTGGIKTWRDGLPRTRIA